MIDEGAHVSKGLVAAVVFSVFVASWASAQAADFSELVRTGSAQQVQAAIAQGADVKALDANRQSSLHVAAQYNKDPAVIAVLAKHRPLTSPPPPEPARAGDSNSRWR